MEIDAKILLERIKKAMSENDVNFLTENEYWIIETGYNDSEFFNECVNLFAKMQNINN